MSYKKILIANLLTFIFCNIFSCCYGVKLGETYDLFVDNKVAGVIDINSTSYCEKFTNEKKYICHYKITFSKQYLIDNNNLPTVCNKIDSTIDSKKLNAPVNEKHAILSSQLTHYNILPLETDFFNCIQSIQNSITDAKDLTIEITFHGSEVQKAIILNFCDTPLNFYLSNSGVNFLIFSNLRNVNFISMNQTKFCDDEVYENTETISKVSILNISQVNNPINRKKSFYQDNSVNDFDESKTLNRSSRVISSSEDKIEKNNKNIAQKKINFYKKHSYERNS